MSGLQAQAFCIAHGVLRQFLAFNLPFCTLLILNPDGHSETPVVAVDDWLSIDFFARQACQCDRTRFPYSCRAFKFKNDAKNKTEWRKNSTRRRAHSMSFFAVFLMLEHALPKSPIQHLNIAACFFNKGWLNSHPILRDRFGVIYIFYATVNEIFSHDFLSSVIIKEILLSFGISFCVAPYPLSFYRIKYLLARIRLRLLQEWVVTYAIQISHIVVECNSEVFYSIVLELCVALPGEE